MNIRDLPLSYKDVIPCFAALVVGLPPLISLGLLLKKLDLAQEVSEEETKVLTVLMDILISLRWKM